jgi:hypothetical protein
MFATIRSCSPLLTVAALSQSDNWSEPRFDPQINPSGAIICTWNF